MSKLSSDPRTVYQPSSVDAPVISQMYRNYVEGDVIGGKYQLVRLLGSGGMGAVWIARNRLLDIEVCLKLIRQGSNELEHRDRLQREARAAARLNDPSIVRVLDFGTTDIGEPYIVMELLQGSDLRTVLTERQRLPPEEAVQLLLPIIRGIATAHDAGIVHRDIKPENIFVARTTSGALQPKLLDFGIAWLDADENGRLTKTGAVLGSPAYMSPEQARGEPTDFRCDLWALVLVLHELLTGEATFDAPNYNAALQLILGKDPEPIERYGIREPVLASVLEAGLSKDPRRRFQSATQLGKSLADWLLSRGITTDLTGHSLREGWFGRVRTPTAIEQEKLSANRVQLGHSDTQLVGTAESSGARAQSRNWKWAVAIGVIAPAAAVGVLLLRAEKLESMADTHPASSSLKSAAVSVERAVHAPEPAHPSGAGLDVIPLPEPLPAPSAAGLTPPSQASGGPANAGVPGAASAAVAKDQVKAGQQSVNGQQSANGQSRPAASSASKAGSGAPPAAASASAKRPAAPAKQAEESFKNPFE